MVKIAETYIHLNLIFSEEQRNEARKFIYERGGFYIEEIFGKHFDPKILEITVRVEGGSTKLRVFLNVASISVIILGITTYGAIRKGIDYIVNDSKIFSEYIFNEYVNESSIPKDKIIRFEKRLGIPGKIQKLFKKIDLLEQSLNITQEVTIKNGHTTVNQKIGIDQKLKSEILSDIIQLFEDLEDKKDRELFFKALPDSIQEDIRKTSNDYDFRKRSDEVMRREEEGNRKKLFLKRSQPPE